MPTLFGHALVGVGVVAFSSHKFEWRKLRSSFFLCSLLAVLPDFDVISFRLGISYGSFFGHRGFSHSLLFAIMMALICALPSLVRFRVGNFILYLIAAVSHPLFDMATDGGLGVAFFAPFYNDRMFFPWHPIPVSPLRLNTRLWEVVAWEGLYFGSLAIALWLGFLWRARRRIAQKHLST
jgi:inner membrane protein